MPILVFIAGILSGLYLSVGSQWAELTYQSLRKNKTTRIKAWMISSCVGIFWPVYRATHNSTN